MNENLIGVRRWNLFMSWHGFVSVTLPIFTKLFAVIKMGKIHNFRLEVTQASVIKRTGT